MTAEFFTFNDDYLMFVMKSEVIAETLLEMKRKFADEQAIFN